MSRLRVVIADDQPMMRAGFKAVLEAPGSIEVVAEAGTGEEAVRRYPALGHRTEPKTGPAPSEPRSRCAWCIMVRAAGPPNTRS